MIELNGFSIGPLALLGSEGVSPGFESVWSRILGDELRSLILVEVASGAPSLVYLARLNLAERILSGRSLQVHRMSLQELGTPPAWPVPAQSTGILIAAERPQMKGTTEDQDAERGLSALWELQRSGALLIAGATAAAGLAETCLIHKKPLPKSPADLEIAVIPGLGLLRGAVVLPYFEHLAPSFIEKASRHVNPRTCLIGVDENAALNIDSSGARCAGLGKVTLLRDNVIEWVGSDGDELPTHVLPPFSQG